MPSSALSKSFLDSSLEAGNPILQALSESGAKNQEPQLVAIARTAIRRWTIAAIVFVGHAMTLVLVVSERSRHAHVLPADDRLPVQLIPTPTLASLKAYASRQRTTARIPAHPLQTLSLPGAEAPDDGAVHGNRRIDWEREAERVARSAVIPTKPKDCDASDEPGSMRPKCRMPGSFEWKPEPGRVGVDGLIPYVRLGKRCVLGLGFAGCGVGPLPEANSHLFDDLQNPDRARGSVPESSR